MTANDPHALLEQGHALAAQGRLNDASARYEQAIRLQPDFIDAYNALAMTFLQRSRADSALGVLRRAIAIGGTAETKALFVQILRGLRAIPNVNDLRDLMVQALSEPWTRPSVVSPIAAALIKHDERLHAIIERAVTAWPQRPLAEWPGAAGLGALVQHRLLLGLLRSTPISDLALEKFLTALRGAVLDLVTADARQAADSNLVELCGALAQQCFLNEYVYACGDDERTHVRGLRHTLARSIADHTPLSEFKVAAFACYAPLHALPHAASLLDRTWSEPLSAVVTQQVREPLEEQRLQASLPFLTTITDDVSIKVRAQYEGNPYPRWVKVAPTIRPLAIVQAVHSEFPLTTKAGSSHDGEEDILAAGCGTGQEAIETALRFPRARVLAIDLSRTSLAYAQRKTAELGLDRIKYAQADILALGTLGRRFDLITAGGVLHHLGDPFAGWRVLLALLKPYGFMRIGIYSELARAHVVAARRFIAERGFQPTTDDIHRCRQDLMRLPDDAPTRKVLAAEDFFTLSECRDLLFHAQEHRHTLPEIAAFLAANDLAFLGFDLRGATLARYRASHPQDTTMTDLSCWHSFERANPDTCVGMYQFWVQKRGSLS